MYDRKNSTFIILMAVVAAISFAGVMYSLLWRTINLDERVTVIEQKLKINQRQ